MKSIVLVLCLVSVGCATTDKVRTLSEATSEGDLKSGVYVNSKGENVHVTAQNLRSRVVELENTLTEAQRQTEYYKRKAQELEMENLTLRARNNYKLQKDTKEVTGFDRANNPVVETKQGASE